MADFGTMLNDASTFSPRVGIGGLPDDWRDIVGPDFLRIQARRRLDAKNFTQDAPLDRSVVDAHGGGFRKIRLRPSSLGEAVGSIAFRSRYAAPSIRTGGIGNDAQIKNNINMSITI